MFVRYLDVIPRNWDLDVSSRFEALLLSCITSLTCVMIPVRLSFMQLYLLNYTSRWGEPDCGPVWTHLAATKWKHGWLRPQHFFQNPRKAMEPLVCYRLGTSGKGFGVCLLGCCGREGKGHLLPRRAAETMDFAPVRLRRRNCFQPYAGAVELKRPLL